VFIICDREFDPALGVDYAAMDNRIRMAVAKELTAKGFQYGMTKDVRYHVSCDVVMDREFEERVLGWSDEDWIRSLKRKGYVRGAMVIQFRNVDSPEPIWVGIFNSNVVLREVSEQAKNERVAYAVSRLLKDFPPK